MKKQLTILLFFLTTIITSCIVFNSRKFRTENYTHEITTNELDVFNGIQINNSNNKFSKKNRALLLFNKDTLKAIISNDIKKLKEYSVTNIAPNTFYLTKKVNGGLFDRMGTRISDSILIKDNIVVHKRGGFPIRQERRNYAYLSNIFLYTIENNKVVKYKVKGNYSLLELVANYKTYTLDSNNIADFKNTDKASFFIEEFL